METFRHPLTTLGAITAGNRIPVDLTKLRAIGQETMGDKILKLARIIFIPVLRAVTVAASQDGIVPGRRVHEIVQRLRIAPVAWPQKYSHDAGGKALRRQMMAEHGYDAGVTAADVADADATVDSTVNIMVEFWRQSAFRPEDFCPPALVVGAGSAEIAIQTPGIDGWTGSLQSCRVEAELFWGDREAPVYTRFQERTIAAPTAFLLNSNPSRFRRLLAMVDGSQGSATTHLAGSFDESVTVQFDCDGQRLTDDWRVDELVDAYNRVSYRDAAAFESRTVPEVIPLLACGHGQKTTKLPRGAQDSRVEMSADPRDTATGTAGSVILVSDETFGPVENSSELDTFVKALGHRGAYDVHPVTGSKVRGIAAHKMDAVPLKIIPKAA